jgi:hypothetical protein
MKTEVPGPPVFGLISKLDVTMNSAGGEFLSCAADPVAVMR